MSEDKGIGGVWVDRDYLVSLEQKAEDYEWNRGYKEGIYDCVEYIERIIKALTGGES